MAAIDFPASPAVDQLFTAPNGITYRWTGALWTVYGTTVLIGATAAPTYDEMHDKLGMNAWGGGVDQLMPITAGTQVFSRPFTANIATSPIEVDITFNAGSGAAGVWAVMALYIDGATNPVAQAPLYVETNQSLKIGRLYWQGPLGAGLHTFQLRGGGSPGGFYLQGNDAGRIGGGVQRTTMVLREIGLGVKM